jgi:hypothetical protein
VQSLEDVFGVSPAEIAADGDLATVPYATTGEQDQPPMQARRALLDPQGSAIFWVALAAVLGLVLVTGQLKVSAALRARGGR